MKKLGFKWDGRGIQLIELIIDLTIVFFGLFIVLYLDGDFQDISISQTFELFRDLVVTHSVLLILSLIFFRVYRTTITSYGFFVVMPKIILALIMANMVTAFVSLIMPTLDFSITLFFYSLVIQVIILGVFKFLFYTFFKRVNIKTAIIIGPREECIVLAKKLLLDKHKYITLKYLFFEDKTNFDELQDIYEYINSVDYIYLTPALFEKKKNAILSYCIDRKKTVFLVPKIYELAIINSKTTQIDDVLTVSVNSMTLSLEQQVIKRAFDLVVSFLGLVVTGPILLVFAIIIKISDGGPILFRQQRLTKDNKPFNLIKFRTMVPDAEKHTGPVLATDKDPRITRLGRFMRKTRIDELPQFINILKGEMSIVGPRPERQFFIEQFVKENPNYKFRLNVKAGVTGLAQSLGKYNTTFEDKLRFDLYYIRNYSFVSDLSILLHTIRAVLDSGSTEGADKSHDFNELLDDAGYIELKEQDVPNLRIIVKK